MPNSFFYSCCKMMKVIFCAIFILHMHFAYAPFVEEIIPSSPIACDSRNPRPSDPVSTLLSGLGDLIVEIDKEFSRQRAPRAIVESDAKDRMYGRPGPGYFNRIREIYRTFQRSFGSNQDLHLSPDIVSSNVQNEGQEPEVATPLHFLKLAVRSNEGLETSDDVEVGGGNVEPGQTLPSYTRNFKLGSSEINMNSNLGPLQTSALLKNAENQIKKILQNVRLPDDDIIDLKTDEDMQEMKLDNGQNLGSELHLDIKEIVPTAAPSESSEAPQMDNSNPEDPIAEGVLHSEDSLDPLTKRHGLRFKHWLGRIFSIKFQINFRID